MKLRMILAIGLFAFPLPAVAAEWWWVGDDNKGDAFFADSQSLTAIGRLKVVWVWSLYKVIQPHADTKARYAIDCDGKTYRVLSEINYDRAGNNSSSDVSGSTQSVVPETMGEAIADFACATPEQYKEKGFLGPVADPAGLFRKIHPLQKPAPRRKK
jgi:hypothetical protein